MPWGSYFFCAKGSVACAQKAPGARFLEDAGMPLISLCVALPCLALLWFLGDALGSLRMLFSIAQHRLALWIAVQNRKSDLVVQRFPSTVRKLSARSFEWAWFQGSLFSRGLKFGPRSPLEFSFIRLVISKPSRPCFSDGRKFA